MQTPTAADCGHPGDLVQHYKGGLYRIEGLATLEASAEPAIVYRPLADPSGARWVRPLAVFQQTVMGLDGRERPRFCPIVQHDAQALRAATDAAGLPPAMVDAVLSRYRETGRFYHAAWHPQDLFARAAAAGLALSRAQTLALLFHDAVYVPGAPPGTNEGLSALLLRQATHLAAGIPPDDVALACTIVEDTAAHRPSVAQSDAVIALDLATLADEPIRFEVWTEMVWLEYRHLFATDPDPRRAFLQRRVRVLGTLGEALAARGPAMPSGFHDRFGVNLARLARQFGD
jgi:hypothetical protein